MVELRQIGENREPVWRAAGRHVRWVQQSRDPQLLLRCFKGQPAVGLHVPGIKAGKVDEVRAVAMEDGAEGEAVPPGRGHVDQPHTWVAGCHSAGPDLQGLSPAHYHTESSGCEMCCLL